MAALSQPPSIPWSSLICGLPPSTEGDHIRKRDEMHAAGPHPPTIKTLEIASGGLPAPFLPAVTGHASSSSPALPHAS